MVLLAFVILIVTIVGCAVSLIGHPSEGIGVPVIAIGVFTFIYLLQPASILLSGEAQCFLDDKMLAKGLLVPVPALLCLMWGWRQGSRGMGKVMQHSNTVRDWDAGRLYKMGLGAACLGTVLHTLLVERSGGLLQAYGAPHGAGFYMTGYTAYIWQGSTWVLTGLAMMILAARKRRLSAAQYIAIALFATLFGVSSLLLGSRTGTFQTLAIMWACWSLARRSRPTIDRAAPALALTGLAAILIFGYRGYVYLGSSRAAEAPGFAEAATAGLGASNPGTCPYDTGLEFVVHSVAIETIDQTGRYDFACNLLPLYTVHIIPRIWWPGKPALRLAEVPRDQWGPGITVHDVLDATGVRLASGHATGIVAEMYMSFGWFSLIFFVWLGWFTRRLLIRAESLDNPLAMCAYAIVFSLTLTMFGQGFGPVLTPIPYMMAPLFLFYWAERRDQWRLAALGIRRRPLPSPEAAGQSYVSVEGK
jgi:hypothetical protein